METVASKTKLILSFSTWKTLTVPSLVPMKMIAVSPKVSSDRHMGSVSILTAWMTSRPTLASFTATRISVRLSLSLYRTAVICNNVRAGLVWDRSIGGDIVRDEKLCSLLRDLDKDARGSAASCQCLRVVKARLFLI